MKRGGVLWWWVWRAYDTKVVYRALQPLGGGKLAPWLFGMMLGSKPKRAL